MPDAPDNPPIAAEQLDDALRHVFGFRDFRANQREIVQALLAGRDVFAVMPTGGGKSLCYQLPAYLLPGTAVVISPLISLMKDQVDAAQANGLQAEYLNSSLAGADRARVLRRLHEGELDLLYIAPERFALPEFLDRLDGVQLSLFAIDEAHCVSEWGHDFRPDYLSLSVIVQRFTHVPVAAFTATATPHVQQDITERLGLREPFCVRASFDRPNLFYQVVPKSDVEGQILDFVRARPNEAGIIYRTTRDSVAGTAAHLRTQGIAALPYHAGLDNEKRQANQEAFNRDQVQVIVATVAFGMGIDKPNVRFVLHADLPKNIESYYQETGRAGRDGEPAHCLLLYGRGDTAKIRYFINNIESVPERDIASQKLNDMIAFAAVNACRRRQLLGYFGEVYESENDNCSSCDVCMGDVERVDATTEARMLMSAIARTEERFGVGHIIDIVVGANTDRIRRLGHDQLPTHGVGKEHARPYWGLIVDNLLAQECIEQTAEQYPTLRLTPKGRDVLFGRRAFSVIRQRQASKRKKNAAAAVTVGQYDEGLFDRLRSLRRELAESQNVPPYIIFSDRTLREMARELPRNLTELRAINGVGDRKLEQYGEAFLAAVGEYARDDRTHVQAEPAEPVRAARGETFEQTWALVQQGLGLDEIARQRGLKAETIASHLERFVLEGRAVDIEAFVEPDTRVEIERLFTELGTASLRPVVDAGQEKFDFAQARLVRAALHKRMNP